MTPSQKLEDEKAKRRPYHFGEKLRQVREHKGYTLKVVAQRTGVSESLVSQIERNHVSPAIDTLLALADVLDINLEYLFEEYKKERPVQIIRSTERPALQEDDITYEGLAKQANSETSIEAYLIKIPAGSHTHRGSYGHLGREIGYVIKGKAALVYDGKNYELEAGDSVSFSAGASHSIENIGDCELEAIWVVTPAQRFIDK
ncbi:MAG: XRE family transcriptional regulator [Treponema sp.]|nr:XRE family transcriptional regulator [Treponema sp.]MCI6891757.1 XRE family transcriptional regulator [Treponema sp.]MCI7566511.1 XRE family transcriptional regulator [Treponema sp.]